MAKKIMFQGTSSNVGKSILCTALAGNGSGLSAPVHQTSDLLDS